MTPHKQPQEKKELHSVVKNDTCYYCTKCHEAHGDGDGFIGQECPGISSYHQEQGWIVDKDSGMD